MFLSTLKESMILLTLLTLLALAAIANASDFDLEGRLIRKELVKVSLQELEAKETLYQGLHKKCASKKEKELYGRYLHEITVMKKQKSLVAVNK